MKIQTILLLLLFFVMTGMMLSSGSNLKKTPASPQGIVSLELAFTRDKAAAIRSQWSETFIDDNGRPVAVPPSEGSGNLLRQARTNTYFDFAFIAAYGALLLHLNYRTNRTNARRRFRNAWLIASACLLDVVENAGVLAFLHAGSYPPLFFSLPALIKFLLLGVAVLWGLKAPAFILNLLQHTTAILKDLFRIAKGLPLTVISLLVLFFTTWMSDQGQDLMLTINDYHEGPLTLYVVIVVLALMNWHFPKFFCNGNWKEQPLGDLFREPFNYKPNARPNLIAIPRLFGVLTFFIPAFGMLRALTVFKVDYFLSSVPPIAMLAGSTVIVHWMFQHQYFQRFYTRFRKLFIAACVIMALTPFLLWPFNMARPVDIRYLCWGLIAYGLLFAMVTANRLPIATAISWLKDKRITPVIWGIVLIPVSIFLFYFICNIFCAPGLPVSYLTFAVVMSGIIFYYALIAILNVIGLKYRLSLSLYVMIAMILVSQIIPNNYHYADKQKGARPNTTTLADYAQQWVRHRLDQPNGMDSVYQIYIVNTHGGGIRAAAWTCLTMTKLDSMHQLAKGEPFQNHVFAYSGASGGTVGASILCANGFGAGTAISSAQYVDFFRKDFLTPVLTGMIGNDVWFGGLSLPGKDRAKVQERLWEHHFERSFGSDCYGRTVDKLWNSGSVQVPLLFSNTTDFLNGKKGVFAPVKITKRDFFESTIVGDLMDSSENLKLSTAAFLSARFPFISPAAGFRKYAHFLDGGMVENTGAETAMEVYKVLAKAIRDLDGGKHQGRFRINIISLKNTYTSDDSVIREKNRNLSQFTAPLTGAINVGLVGNSNKAERFNQDYFRYTFNDPLRGQYQQIAPRINKLPVIRRAIMGIERAADSAEIPLPLGWSISEFALESMQLSLIRHCQPGQPLYRLVYGDNPPVVAAPVLGGK